MEKKYNNFPIYVVLGTRAQFIKVAPLMRRMADEGMAYTLIYTAQHIENINEILDVYCLPKPDRVMYNWGEANTKSSFVRWFCVLLFRAIFQAKEYIPVSGLLLTHGDTFTAWLAALMGKRAGCQVAHIESGCRSFNILSPFPEELSRLIIFHLTDIYFCADAWAMENLRRYAGLKINMGANTMLDGVRYAVEHPPSTQFSFQGRPYAVVSIHRFENIFTSRFKDVILPLLMEIARFRHLVFTLHPTTRERLTALGLYDELNRNENITLHPRFGFLDWISVCNSADFVITDGGSNQQELSYLGVPTLLFRKETESREGLGQNIVLSGFDRGKIKNFLENLEAFRKARSPMSVQPSESIIRVIRDAQSSK